MKILGTMDDESDDEEEEAKAGGKVLILHEAGSGIHKAAGVLWPSSI